VVTIEKTGKGLKLQGALAVLAVLTGVILIIIGANHNEGSKLGWGIALFVFGIFWRLMVTLLRWWRHG